MLLLTMNIAYLAHNTPFDIFITLFLTQEDTKLRREGKRRERTGILLALNT
jgi:hypothetical protein